MKKGKKCSSKKNHFSYFQKGASYYSYMETVRKGIVTVKNWKQT